MNMLAGSGSFTSAGLLLAGKIVSNIRLMFSYKVVIIPSDTLLVVITFVVPDRNSVDVIMMTFFDELCNNKIKEICRLRNYQIFKFPNSQTLKF